MNVAYKKKNYKIYFFENGGYIIHNTKGEFSQHHTHINNYNTAKYLINLSLHNTIPYHLSNYLLESLIRISLDKEYKKKLKEILNKQKNKSRR